MISSKAAKPPLERYCEIAPLEYTPERTRRTAFLDVRSHRRAYALAGDRDTHTAEAEEGDPEEYSQEKAMDQLPGQRIPRAQLEGQG